MKVLHEFECGCNIIINSEWEWEIITCIPHSRRREPEQGGGYSRYITLTKPIKEMVHP